MPDPTPCRPAGAERTDLDEIVYLVSHDLRASLRAPNEVSQRIKDDLEKGGIPAGKETARRHRFDEPPRAPSRPEDVRLSRPVPRRPEAGSGSWGYLQRALRCPRGTADTRPGVAIDRDFGWDGLKIGTRDTFTPPGPVRSRLPGRWETGDGDVVLRWLAPLRYIADAPKPTIGHRATPRGHAPRPHRTAWPSSVRRL